MSCEDVYSSMASTNHNATLPQKNLSASGISALIVVVLFVSLGANPRMQSSPNYEYQVLDQIKQQNQAKHIHEAAMQARQQAQNEKQVADICFSKVSTIVLDVPAKKIEHTLNKFGSENWELAGIIEAFYILKRSVK